MLLLASRAAPPGGDTCASTRPGFTEHPAPTKVGWMVAFNAAGSFAASLLLPAFAKHEWMREACG